MSKQIKDKLADLIGKEFKSVLGENRVILTKVHGGDVHTHVAGSPTIPKVFKLKTFDSLFVKVDD